MGRQSSRVGWSRRRPDRNRERRFCLLHEQPIPDVYENAMSSDPSILKSTSGSWCLGQVASMREITGNAFRWVNAGMTVRFLRGRKMETYEALFDECAA